MTKTILRSIIRALLRLVAKIEIINKENLRESGSYAFATNHLGILDALLAYYVLERWDFFIPVAEKWEEYTFLRWLGKHLNVIFIDRYNPDIHALRQILRRMDEGQVLIIAPEGTRSRNEKMAEGKSGVSYLAAKSQFPVIPVALAGTEDRVFFSNLKRLKRTKVTVTVGKAFTLPPLPKKNKDEALKKYTDEIMCKIAVMLPEKNRGFYAEHQKLKELLAN
jgi:1-acyl-sn-glycerol-3-phosphate acyltransferase